MSSEIAATLVLGILALSLLVYGSRRGFFAPIYSETWQVPIRLIHLLGAFTIYFLITFLIARLFVPLFRNEILLHFTAYSSILNFSASFLILSSLALYIKKLPKEVKEGILLQNHSAIHHFREDVWSAIFAWSIAFPLVLFISKVLEILIELIFKVKTLPDQNAVLFLKSTFGQPIYFILASLSIVILAPLIEETLFRGFLQTFIRKHLGSKQAIFITSVCFSLFHYTTTQGLGNISIIPPLFLLSLFLGYLYEKQRSLLSPILLHSIFNTISVINLYLFGGLTTGL